MVIDTDRAERSAHCRTSMVTEIGPDGLACLRAFTYQEARRWQSPAADLLQGTELSSNCESGKPSRCGSMKTTEASGSVSESTVHHSLLIYRVYLRTYKD